jgi:hypothetical protein
MEHERGAFKVNRGPVGYAVKKSPQNDRLSCRFDACLRAALQKYDAENLDNLPYLLIK